MTRTVARLLAESLQAHEVDQIFCVPGESYVGLTSALAAKQLAGPAERRAELPSAAYSVTVASASDAATGKPAPGVTPPSK